MKHYQRLPKFLGYSSGWKTPSNILDALKREFDFDFDPCPTNSPHALLDGLSCDWGQRSFVNPPYGHKHIEQIGRASCRERVKNSEVAVSLKKKRAYEM